MTDEWALLRKLASRENIRFEPARRFRIKASEDPQAAIVDFPKSQGAQ